MASEILRRNPTSTGNRRVFTWAGWVKFNKLSTVANCIWYAASSGSSEFNISLVSSTGALNVYDYAPSAYQYQYVTSRLLRDFSNWFHLVVAVDTTQFREDDRFKIYINGALYNGSYSTEVTVGGINHNTRMNTPGEINTIGQNISGGVNYDANCELADMFMVDGQALTPDVFGFYKQGKGHISVGSTQATDFRPGQWVPKTPRVIKTEINRRGGFGVNGFYLPMNDSRNFGADFHCDPNSIITLNEKLPQPRVGVATTASVGLGYTDALRADPFAANLVLALPFVSGGLSSGFGDYSHIIRGSGSAKSITVSGNTTIANVGTAETASVFYGSGAKFDGVDDYITIPNSSDFSFGSGDFTVECWANFGNFSAATSLVNVFENATARRSWSMEGRSSGGFRFEWWYDGSTSQSIDASANTLSRGQWNHFAMVRKGTAITGYINGVAIGIKTDVGSQSLFNNTTDPLVIGALFTSGTPVQDFTGYIQDLRVYKGVAKYTGGFDVPRPYTPVGIATWRAVPDTTANNFATMNPLIEARPSSGNNSPSNSTIVTFADGNLNLSNAASSGNAQRMVSFATIGISTGKWYYEEIPSSNSRVGLTKGFQQLNYTGTLGSGSGLEASVTYGASGAIGIANSAYYNTATTLTPPSFNNTNIIGVSIDASLGENNLTVRFYKDGVGVSTLTGVGATSAVREWFPTKTMESSGSGDQRYFNFGQNPTFSGNTTAGTFTDSNGKGLFKYQPPSGFLALCEDNLPTPAISDPGKYFKTVLWTGDGNNSRSIVGVGFTPDLVWIKSRTSTNYHNFTDSVRGPGLIIQSNTTTAEQNASSHNGSIGSFDFNGFSVSSGLSVGDVNGSGNNFVAWCWRAGAGTTSTNTNGSITSVVSVNQDAGFSIVSYTGNGGSSAVTVGHGLGKVPSLIICKGRQFASNWITWHKSLNGGNVGDYYLRLNATDAQSNAGSSAWNNTAPTSTTFTVGASSNTNGPSPMIAYCWAEIEGFSKFGSYVGNGNADGPMVWCGFKPACVITKRTDSTGGWQILDSSRMSINSSNTPTLFPNTSGIELGTDVMDFLSNGFKFRSTGTDYNASSGTYIFAAWAESPFQTANSK